MSLIKIPDKGVFWRISERLRLNAKDPVEQYFYRYPAYANSLDALINDIYKSSNVSKTDIFNKIIELIISKDLEIIYM